MPKIDGGHMHGLSRQISPPLIRRRPKNPTWKHTFNGSLLHTDNIDKIVEVARYSKYPFFTTGDGNVYITPKYGSWADSVCTVSSLETPRKRRRR